MIFQCVRSFLKGVLATKSKKKAEIRLVSSRTHPTIDRINFPGFSKQPHHAARVNVVIDTAFTSHPIVRCRDPISIPISIRELVSGTRFTVPIRDISFPRPTAFFSLFPLFPSSFFPSRRYTRIRARSGRGRFSFFSSCLGVFVFLFPLLSSGISASNRRFSHRPCCIPWSQFLSILRFRISWSWNFPKLFPVYRKWKINSAFFLFFFFLEEE